MHCVSGSPSAESHFSTKTWQESTIVSIFSKPSTESQPAVTYYIRPSTPRLYARCKKRDGAPLVLPIPTSCRRWWASKRAHPLNRSPSPEASSSLKSGDPEQVPRSKGMVFPMDTMSVHSFRCVRAASAVRCGLSDEFQKNRGKPVRTRIRGGGGVERSEQTKARTLVQGKEQIETKSWLRSKGTTCWPQRQAAASDGQKQRGSLIFPTKESADVLP